MNLGSWLQQQRMNISLMNIEFFTSDENVDGVEPFVTFISCRVHETVDLMLRLVVVVGWVHERGGGGSLKCLRSGGC